MAKLGQIKSGVMRVGNTTATGYGIVYADEIIGHRRVAQYSDLNNIPDWCLYNKAGGDEASTAVGQLWYVSTGDSSHSAGLYQLTAYDGETRTWTYFKNGAAAADTNTTYSLSGKEATVTLTGSDGKVTSVTVDNVANANSATIATQAVLDDDGNIITNTYLTKTAASSTYATKTDVASLTSALVYKGTVDATHALPTTGVKVGDVYVVAAAGTFAGQVCENGDMIIASSTTPTWTVVQANINGAVTSSGTLNSNAIVLGDGNRSVKTFATTSTAGYLYWTGTAYSWKTPAEFSLKAATADSLGGIKIGYTTNGRNYPVLLGTDSKAYVNVPWTDTDTKYTLPASSTTALGGGKVTAVDKDVAIVNNMPTAAGVKNVGVHLDSSTNTYYVPIIDDDTKYTLPAASSTTLGGVKLGNDTKQTVAANAVSATSDRTYAVLNNANGQLVVNVPWVDTNTIPVLATSERDGYISAADYNKLVDICLPVSITTSLLDTCGVVDINTLVTMAALQKDGLKFYVSDQAAIVHVTTDNMKHAVVQTITTNCTLDEKTWQFPSDGTVAHKDGIIYTYQRYYPISGTYDSSVKNAWTKWQIINVDTLFYDDSDTLSSNYNEIMMLNGQLKLASVSTNNNTVTFNSIHTNVSGYGLKEDSKVIAEPIPKASITALF